MTTALPPTLNGVRVFSAAAWHEGCALHRVRTVRPVSTPAPERQIGSTAGADHDAEAGRVDVSRLSTTETRKGQSMRVLICSTAHPMRPLNAFTVDTHATEKLDQHLTVSAAGPST